MAMRRHQELLCDAGLALFVLAAAAAVVRYLGVHDTSAREVFEAEAVRAIERVGGKVIRDEKAPGKPVIAVFLNTPAMTDAGLEVLGELKQLQELDLTGSRVTASGLKELAGLQQLRTLHLGETQWWIPSNVGLFHVNPGLSEALVRLRQLKTLHLHCDKHKADEFSIPEQVMRRSEESLQRWVQERLPGCRVIVSN
jgi:hypothetical protein